MGEARVNMEEEGDIHHNNNLRVEISILVKAIHHLNRHTLHLNSHMTEISILMKAIRILRIELEWEEPLLDIMRSIIQHETIDLEREELSIRVDMLTIILHRGEMECRRVLATREYPLKIEM